jgi:hypothetical protein
VPEDSQRCPPDAEEMAEGMKILEGAKRLSFEIQTACNRYSASPITASAQTWRAYGYDLLMARRLAVLTRATA